MNPRARHYPDLRRNNVAREENLATVLACGHETKEPPLATRGDGTRLWSCRQGCTGLQKAKSGQRRDA